jgi:hypothetical protein
MDTNDGLDDVGKWLEEGPPPVTDAGFDDLIAEEPVRQFRGSPRWFDQTIPEDEEILKESDATKRRARARWISSTFGWLFDFGLALYWWFASWWTADVFLGLFRAAYGLAMLGLVTAIFYSVFYATKNAPPGRTLPTVEELMETPSHGRPTKKEGSPNPTEGQR